MPRGILRAPRMTDRLSAALAALLLATSASAAGTGQAQATEAEGVSGAPPAETAAAVARSAGQRDGFALPFVFYTPDTRFGVGGTAGIHAHVGGAPRPSSLFATAIYTVNGQGAVDLVGQLYPAGPFVFQGTARVTHFPNAFYGIGPHSQKSDREDFTQRYVETNLVADHTLTAHLRAGPRLHLRAEEEWHLERDGALASGGIAGAKGFNAVGVGAGVTWDDRDNLFAPTRGRFVEAWYLGYPGQVGHHDPFGRVGLNVRGFTSPIPGHVLGFEAYGEYAHGEVPFTMLPRFGGAQRMRGFAEGRYRDHAHYAFQGEYRFPLYRRLGGVAFATLGDVAPRPDAFALRDAKASAGAGLRLRLTQEGAALRFDVAAAPEGLSTYAVVLQAF